MLGYYERTTFEGETARSTFWSRFLLKQRSKDFTGNIWEIIVVTRSCIFPHETSKDALHFGNGKCIEVRLSLLKHHFFHKGIMNATTQLKSYDRTQA